MPRFGMTKSDYGDFYEEDGITYLPAVLTIDFPESYQAGDFIKIDQWYDIQPISFHLLGGLRSYTLMMKDWFASAW